MSEKKIENFKVSMLLRIICWFCVSSFRKCWRSSCREDACLRVLACAIVTDKCRIFSSSSFIFKSTHCIIVYVLPDSCEYICIYKPTTFKGIQSQTIAYLFVCFRRANLAARLSNLPLSYLLITILKNKHPYIKIDIGTVWFTRFHRWSLQIMLNSLSDFTLIKK